MAIIKCPDCGAYKTQPTRIRTLPRFLKWLLPMQSGECVECGRRRLQVLWRQIPINLVVWMIVLASLFVFRKWVGLVRPVPPKTYQKERAEHKRQKLLPPNMLKVAIEKTQAAAKEKVAAKEVTAQEIVPKEVVAKEVIDKKAVAKEVAVKEVEIGRLKQKINDLETKVVRYEDRFTSLETQLMESKVKDRNIESINTANSVPVLQTEPSNLATEDENLVVLKSLEKWRTAWQSQDIAAYLARYTKDFGNASGKSRKAWIKERELKLKKPKYVSVVIDDIRLRKLDDSQWEARFRQVYKSDLYKDIVNKTLILRKIGNQYLIDDERS